MTTKIANKKALSAQPRKIRFVLLDLGEECCDRFGRSQTLWCRDAETIRTAVERSANDVLWISSTSKMTEELLNVVSAFILQNHGSRRTFGDLLMLRAPRLAAFPPLLGCFHRLIGGVPSFKTLPTEQLAGVLLSDARRDLFLGGIVDEETGTLALVRGNLDTLTIPLSLFQPTGAAKPDFGKFDLDDFGQSIKFGGYEASSDSVLYETDPDYRKRLNTKRRAEDQGFGASLRRLRKQKGLSRDAFPGLAEKTIARIERGEVGKPHGKTLATIASVLGVSPDEIETY
jgi:hypothetical protein